MRAAPTLVFLFSLLWLSPAPALPARFYACLKNLCKVADHGERMQRLARAAGLHYRDEFGAGITRRRAGGGFEYRTDGKAIPEGKETARIDQLGIPPEWKQVWISPDPLSHIQATGVDSHGRTQYVYHRRWVEARDALKFERLADFGQRLAALRTQVEADIQGPKLSRQRVLAAMVKLVEKTLIRVGHEEYVVENGSFGLTTLRPEHLVLSGDKIRLRFPGKSHVFHDIEIEDAEVAAVLRECRAARGDSLFVFRGPTDGAIHSLGADALNDYLHEYAGREFSVKDFRTWHGSVEALRALRVAGGSPDAAVRKQREDAAVAAAAERLGNTPEVCRASYVYPGALVAYQNGRLQQAYRGPVRANERGLSEDERALLRLTAMRP